MISTTAEFQGQFIASPGTLLEAMPRPGCFWMPPSSAKASGNRAKISWILNKLGFLSNIVREILIPFTPFPSDKKEPKQNGSLGTMVCCELSENDFFFKEGWWKGEEETRRKELRGSIYLDIILESWQWRRQYRVSLVERPEHIM